MVKDYNRDLLWDYLHQLGTATAIFYPPPFIFQNTHSVLFYAKSTNLALMMIIFIRESKLILKCTHRFSMFLGCQIHIF